MAEDSTRRLLKVFGIAVTSLEDALEADQADEVRKAAAELRERMKEMIELVERMSDRAATSSPFLYAARASSRRPARSSARPSPRWAMVYLAG